MEKAKVIFCKTDIQIRPSIAAMSRADYPVKTKTGEGYDNKSQS
jgi:hypothetical protein